MDSFIQFNILCSVRHGKNRGSSQCSILDYFFALRIFIRVYSKMIMTAKS